MSGLGQLRSEPAIFDSISCNRSVTLKKAPGQGVHCISLVIFPARLDAALRHVCGVPNHRMGQLNAELSSHHRHSKLENRASNCFFYPARWWQRD